MAPAAPQPKTHKTEEEVLKTEVVGDWQGADNANEMVLARGAHGRYGVKSRLSANFPRSRDLVFQASLQAVRGIHCEVLALDRANSHARFGVSAPPGPTTEHDLFVFDAPDGTAELDITSITLGEAGCFEPLYQAIVTEVGKYLMFVREAPPPRLPVRLPGGNGAYGRAGRRRRRSNSGSGMATASLILGIVGMVAWCIPLFGFPTNLVGLVLGAASWNSRGRGMAVAGVILSVVGLILSAVNSFLGIMIAFGHA